jgi:hypothetical protein
MFLWCPFQRDFSLWDYDWDYNVKTQKIKIIKINYMNNKFNFSRATETRILSEFAGFLLPVIYRDTPFTA